MDYQVQNINNKIRKKQQEKAEMKIILNLKNKSPEKIIF